MAEALSIVFDDMTNVCRKHLPISVADSIQIFIHLTKNQPAFGAWQVLISDPHPQKKPYKKLMPLYAGCANIPDGEYCKV